MDNALIARLYINGSSSKNDLEVFSMKKGYLKVNEYKDLEKERYDELSELYKRIDNI